MIKKIVPTSTSNFSRVAQNSYRVLPPQIKEVGKIFTDKTVKQCSVNIKPRGWSEEFCEILPKSYTYIDFDGHRKAAEVVEIDWLEATNKGHGDGTRKIREIIDYAKRNTDGRLIVTAAQYGENQNPLLFYYRNGLRSNDARVNNILKQVDLGIRPKSDLPKSAFMFLPKD